MSNSDTPAKVGSSEELGPEPERGELTAVLDESGSVVLINEQGDIVFYAADGKMQVQRRGKECDACTEANLHLAEAVALAWNNRRGATAQRRRPCALKA